MGYAARHPDKEKVRTEQHWLAERTLGDAQEDSIVYSESATNQISLTRCEDRDAVSATNRFKGFCVIDFHPRRAGQRCASRLFFFSIRRLTCLRPQEK